MALGGDPQGIAALKAMHQKNQGFVKAVLEDARSTTDNISFFRGDDGVRYKVTLDPASGDLDIQPAPRTQPPPPVT
jgi:hypothetical protein